MTAQKLKTYLVRLPIAAASGYQVYEVEAASLAQARQLWQDHAGDYECTGEEIEVTALGEPEFEEVGE